MKFRNSGPVAARAVAGASGSACATYLAVTDIEAAHRELGERGVKVSDIRRKSPIDGPTGGER